MPINISDELPAIKVLESENIFVMRHEKAIHQDIRPLEILLMNLMPDRITTETQFLRLLGNTPIQVQVTLIHPKTHECTHTDKEHLTAFYKNFDDIKDKKFDGLIITGAPVENLNFEEVNYWEELKQLMDWSEKNITSTIFVCWAAQAALYHFYGIKKYPLKEKMFGVFPHKKNKRNIKLFRGFDDLFYVPHSRHTEIKSEEINANKELEILSESEESGVYVVSAREGKQIFITGHSEYDPETLKKEYDRDVGKGLPINIPKNYYPNDDPTKEPIVLWRGHSHLLFSNWLNYYVYQETPAKL